MKNVYTADFHDRKNSKINSSRKKKHQYISSFNENFKNLNYYKGNIAKKKKYNLPVHEGLSNPSISCHLTHLPSGIQQLFLHFVPMAAQASSMAL